MQVQTLVPKKAKRILVIEDEPDFLAPLVAWLRRDGYSPFPARSRNEALNKLLSESFPFILMDYHMPGMAAVDFVELVRKLHPKTILILSSGHPNAYEAASSLGISYVIQKPFNDEDLRSLLKRIDMAHGVA